jgi:7-carboxy-7-deazaguanine synthase
MQEYSYVTWRPKVLKISQIFGPTIQGEGSAAGRHCMFVRTYNCNLRCRWCDTAYTWADTEERAAMTLTGKQYDRNDPVLGLKEMTHNEVYEKLSLLWPVALKPTIIVISGGEPMMQQADLLPLMSMLRNVRNEVHIETAGTIAPTYEFGMYVNQYNVSPKLHHSGNEVKKRYKPEVLSVLRGSGKAWFKFVVTPVTLDVDFEEIDEIVETVGIDPRRVMIMPEGRNVTDTLECARKASMQAIHRGYGISFRTHVLLWGDDPHK